MALTNYSMVNQDPETYRRCHEILGISEEVEWSDLKVEFGTELYGQVTLVLIPSGEQVRQLAELAVQQLSSPVYGKSDMPDEDHLEQALLDEARASVALDGDTRS